MVVDNIYYPRIFLEGLRKPSGCTAGPQAKNKPRDVSNTYHDFQLLSRNYRLQVFVAEIQCIILAFGGWMLNATQRFGRRCSYNLHVRKPKLRITQPQLLMKFNFQERCSSTHPAQRKVGPRVSTLACKRQLNSPVSVSPGTPRLSELSLMKASVELVNVCGDNVRSWPLSESNRSKDAVLPPLPATTTYVTL